MQGVRRLGLPSQLNSPGWTPLGPSFPIHEVWVRISPYLHCCIAQGRKRTHTPGTIQMFGEIMKYRRKLSVWCQYQALEGPNPVPQAVPTLGFAGGFCLQAPVLLATRVLSGPGQGRLGCWGERGEADASRSSLRSATTGSRWMKRWQ